MTLRKNIDQAGDIACQGARFYSAGTKWIDEVLFQQGLEQAAQMGLEGAAATQYANQAAENALTQSGTTIGKWLPYIGMGLTLYRFATGKADFKQTAFNVSQTALYMAHPALVIPGLMFVGGSQLMKSDDTKPQMAWHNPVLELIHKEGDVHYFVDSGQGWGTQPELLKYNVKTNELEQGKLDKEKHKSLEGIVGGLDQIEWQEFDPDLHYSEEPVGGRSGKNTWIAATYYNMASLQAQIYNKAILPSGKIPKAEENLTAVTLDGKRYWADSSGVVFNSGGKIIGKLSEDRESVESLRANETSSINIKSGEVSPITSLRLNEELQTGKVADIYSPAFMDSDDEIIAGLPHDYNSINRLRNDLTVKNIDQHSQGELYLNDKLIGYVNAYNGYAMDLQGNFLGSVNGAEDPTLDYTETGIGQNYKEGDPLAIDFGLPWYLERSGEEHIRETLGAPALAEPGETLQPSTSAPFLETGPDQVLQPGDPVLPEPEPTPGPDQQPGPEPDKKFRVGPGIHTWFGDETKKRIILGNGSSDPLTILNKENNNMALPPFLRQLGQQTVQRPAGYISPANEYQTVYKPGFQPQPPGIQVPGAPQPPGIEVPRSESVPGMSGQAPIGNLLQMLMSGLQGQKPQNTGRNSMDTVLNILKALVQSGQLR